MIKIIENKEFLANAQKEVLQIKKSHNLFESIPFPYMVITKGIIIDSNLSFIETFDASVGKSIRTIFPQLDITVKKQIIKFNESSYRVFTQKMHDVDYYLIYFIERFYDNYDGVSLIQDKISVAYIFIDNYDEALELVEEARIPLILALVDRKLNAFAKKINGIIKKFEKDRYILLFSEDNLMYLKEKRFDILNQIREVEMGNKISLTLSIGIGYGNENLSELSNHARIALDLALGRGGDQVVLKNGDLFEFYGGAGKEQNKNKMVKARVKAYIFAELIEDASDIIIMGHTHPDMDCLAAGIGVYKIIKTINPNANANIVINEVNTSISSLYNQLMEEELYKTGVFITSEEAIKKVRRNTLVVVVDVYRQAITECPQLIDISKKVIVFDHHRKASDHIKNEVLIYHDSTASSTSELITEMLMYIKANVRLLNIETDALLAGITVDTKGFTFKTGSKTFEAASYLKKKGADSHNVHVLLQSDMETYRAKSDAVANAEIYKDEVAFSVIYSKVSNPMLVVAQTADDLLNLVNMKMSFVFFEGDDKILVSARSLGGYNVQAVMEKFGGGGHRTIAAAQIKNMSLETLILEIKNIVNQMLEEVL